MNIRKIINNQWFYGICLYLITTALGYLLTSEEKLEFRFWQCAVFLLFWILIPPCIQTIYKNYRIRKIIKEYTYGRFGNSFCYKWEYAKSRNGIYGYEPVNIQLAESKTVPEGSHVKVFSFGYAVSEQKLKLLIKFTVYCLVEKKEEILPFLKYLYDTEEQ